MTTKINTNQELYREITANLKLRSSSERSLAQYLGRLLELVSIKCNEESLTLDEFAHMLDTAFDGEIPSMDLPHLRDLMNDNSEKPGWQRSLAAQIVDLQEMETAGILDDESRYFGVDSPSGARWYNFDPKTYIECGISGSLGGWEPSDDASRKYVPGLVAIMDTDGNVTSVNPEDIVDPVCEMEVVSWDDFADFIWAGQNYE